MRQLKRLTVVSVLALLCIAAAGRLEQLLAAPVPLTGGDLAEALRLGAWAQPATWQIAGAAAAGLVLAHPKVAWPALRRLLTLFHEAGHVAIATVYGARPHGLVVNGDGSGHAAFAWPRRRTPLRRFAHASVAFAGEVSAPLFVLASVHLLLTVGPLPVWGLLAAVGAAALLLSRSLLAFTLAGLVVAAAATALSPQLASWSFSAAVVLLAALTATSAIDLFQKLSGGTFDAGSDQRVVAAKVFVPARIVMVAQTLIGWAATAAAGYTLAVGVAM